MCVFQWFFISLSVLPGSLAAILDHLHMWMHDIKSNDKLIPEKGSIMFFVEPRLKY